MPIPKGSDKDPYFPLSNHGISLLSCICKVDTGVINARIKNYFDDIDMSKAFDNVNRDLLYYKLLKYNIDGTI